MQYGYCKYRMCFKKDIFKISGPSKYNMRILTPHKKEGRPKPILGRYISIPTLSIGKINTDEICADESEFSNSNIILDEFHIKEGIIA